VFITCYLSINKLYILYFDINSKSILISERIYQAFYFYILHYFITKNKRLRYKKINEIVTFTLCAKIFLRLKKNKDRKKIVIEKTYIVSSLLCDVIVKIELLKLNRIIIK